MSVSAEMIFDAADDLDRRISGLSDTRLDYSTLLAGYQRLSLPPGSGVMILAPNSLEFVFHWIAALASGYVPCAVPPSTRIATIQTLQRSLSLAAVIGPRVDHMLDPSARRSRIGSYDVAVRDDIAPAYTPFEVLILTTGTSGRQTACVHGLGSLVWNAGMTNKVLGITAADRQLVVLPMYHSFGLVTQTVGAIISGCELKIDGPPFSAGRFAALLHDQRISVCGLTPTIVRDLLRRETVLPPLRVMSIGGDQMMPDEVEKLLLKPFIDELYVTYGLTEAGPRVAVLPAHDAPVELFDSVGQAFPSIRTKIDAADGDGVGQLLVSTPSACRRKVGDGIVRQPFTSDNFLETGDLFTKDAAGYLRYKARGADILVIKGEKLNTRNVDLVASMHPDVEFARTTAGAQDSLVTRLWARGGKLLDLDDVRAFMRSLLRAHEIPEVLVQQESSAFHK